MAQIPRPPKQGNVTTYVQKVAAGFPRILAGEMDADLDTIYGAWNAGADTANIADGAITSAKLAADSVGPRELQDAAVQTAQLAAAAVTTPKLGDLQVTDAKIAGLSWAKLTGAPVSLPPSGPAGGALAGSYPNPILAPGAIPASSVGAAEIADGSVGTAELGAAAVTRAKLAPGALPGGVVSVTLSSFATATVGSWVPVIALPALVTRGANPVFLFANHGLAGTTLGAPGVIQIRWTRNGTQLCAAGFGPNGASPQFLLPGLPWVDLVPAAGSYVYQLEVLLGTGATTVQFAGGAGCGLAAVEIG